MYLELKLEEILSSELITQMQKSKINLMCAITYVLCAARQPQLGVLYYFNFHTVLHSRDTTQTGHILGGAKLRTNIPAPERDLPPPAMCIFRAIMHSAFLMCACHNPDKLPKLANLVKPSLSKPQLLPEFFWMHLRKDLEHLSRSTGEGMEESSIIVHLVLQDMSNQVDCEYKCINHAAR